MNILFLIRSLNPGGAERQLVNVAAGLKKKGHQITVVTFYPGGILRDKLEMAEVPIFSLDKKSRWDIFSFYFLLRQIVQDIKPDIIHGYTGVPNCLSLLARRFYLPAKVVWGVRASNIDLSEYGLVATLLYKLECFLAKYADLIISNSKAGRDYALSSGFPNETMQVVYNGIDTQTFKPDGRERSRIRRLLNIDDDTLLVGRVARLDPMKGYPTFIEAVELLYNDEKNIAALVIGSGPKEYSAFLKREVLERGLIDYFHWKSARRDVASYMNAFDIFVSSSEFGEGFPNVIAEAMACGIPCVVSDVGDSAFVVGDNGDVVPAHDSAALADAVNTLFLKLKVSDGELSSRVRERIVENFTVNKLVKNTEEMLNAVINSDA